MKNHWSVDEEQFKKYPEKYDIWKLEQRINFGIGAEKINRSMLQKYWEKIDIDPYKRKVLSLVILK